MGQGGGALFLVAKMSQNSVDDVLVLDASDDFDGTTGRNLLILFFSQ